MRIKSGELEKIIPAKYHKFADNFNFTHEGKRLSVDERFSLMVMNVIDYFKDKQVHSYQDKFVRDLILESASESNMKVVKVYKRSTGTLWRILVDNFEISVTGALVSDCPGKYLIRKNEL